MTKQIIHVNVNEQIQMSHQQQWHNNFKLHNQIGIEEIPNSCFQTVYRLLREDINKPKFRKPNPNHVSIFYIDPLTTSISVWNFIVIFAVYFIQFQVSLFLGFGPTFWDTQIQMTGFIYGYVFLLIILLIDIPINFNKGYYAFGYGKVIDDKTLIMKRYVKSYFIIDMISIIVLTFPFFHRAYAFNFLQLIPLVLLFVKKFKCQTEIIRVLESQYISRIVFILGMLGCDVMLLGNFGACLFLGIDILLWRLQFFESNPIYFWLSNNTSYSIDLMDGPRIAQYVYAQSYSTGTLSTLAPGPFGKNPIQITMQLFIMIFFMILASYVGQVLLSLLYFKQQVRIFHDNNIMKFDNFMSLKGVVSKIKMRVHNFFQLIWQFEVKTDSQTQKATIDKLPLSIQQDLLAQISFAHEMFFIQFFSLSEQIQRIISFKIKSYVVDPKATIFQIGFPLDAVGQGYIYYIKNGLAKYYFEYIQNQHIVSLSNTKKIVGQYEFITGLSHPFNCKSIDLCVIDRISYSQLKSIIRNFGLQQQFHILKTRVLLYNQLKLIDKHCLICDGSHVQNKCPTIFIHQQISSQYHQNEKLYKHQPRLKYPRPKLQSKIFNKKMKVIEPKALRKLKSFLYPSMINKAQVGIGANWNTDAATQYELYYSQYNIQQES